MLKEATHDIICKPNDHVLIIKIKKLSCGIYLNICYSTACANAKHLTDSGRGV